MASQKQPADDGERFARWSREHAPAVRGYLLALGNRPEVADDLAQEVFCRAWQARRRYREQGNARAYLLRIADRLVVDRARKAGREINLGEDDWRQVEPVAHVEPPEHAVRAEAVEQLHAAMENLSPLQRRVLLLRYYGQLSFVEIAQTIDCPLNTTLSHARRGLLALRKIMVENQP